MDTPISRILVHIPRMPREGQRRGEPCANFLAFLENRCGGVIISVLTINGEKMINRGDDRNDFNQVVRGAKPDATLDDKSIFKLFCNHMVKIIEKLPVKHRGLSKLYNHLADMKDETIPRKRGYFIESDIMITEAIDGFKPWKNIEQSKPKRNAGSKALGSFINEHTIVIGYHVEYSDGSLYEAGSGKKSALLVQNG